MKDTRPEATFKHTLTKALGTVKKCVQEIESPGTGVGIPDVYVGKGIWIETKRIPLDFSTHIAIPFEPGQYPWLLHHAVDGGSSIVAIEWSDRVTLSHVTELHELPLGHYGVLVCRAYPKHGWEKQVGDMLSYMETPPLPF